MKRTAVELVRLAWEAGMLGDSEGARLIGADAARLDAAHVSTRQKAREARHELAKVRADLAKARES